LQGGIHVHLRKNQGRHFRWLGKSGPGRGAWNGAIRGKLDWKHSIVDLMKLLKLDSSLNARKELAKELGYTGKTDGSAEMNIWLHKQVVKKLEENGGQVPADMRS
jgi:hypothetical protein